MPSPVAMFGRMVGDGHPCLVVAEIGVNHNGSADLARRLVRAAFDAGADVVKFQVRTPELATPAHRRHALRFSCTTADPDEQITELEHRQRIELGADDYASLMRLSESLGKPGCLFASAWDVPSVDALEALGVPAYKIASASVTDGELVKRIAETGKPVIASTGMSTLAEIDRMVSMLDGGKLVLLHTCSAYPADNADIHLRVMDTLKARYGVPVGYSGHERGLQVSLAAAARGACVIERHITLDRAMRGSDHAGSVEPAGLAMLVRDIRAVEQALGSADKTVLPCERAPREKLRKAVA